jgi:hypothetical protein
MESILGEWSILHGNHLSKFFTGMYNRVDGSDYRFEPILSIGKEEAEAHCTKAQLLWRHSVHDRCDGRILFWDIESSLKYFSDGKGDTNRRHPQAHRDRSGIDGHQEKVQRGNPLLHEPPVNETWHRGQARIAEGPKEGHE